MQYLKELERSSACHACRQPFEQNTKPCSSCSLLVRRRPTKSRHCEHVICQQCLLESYLMHNQQPQDESCPLHDERRQHQRQRQRQRQRQQRRRATMPRYLPCPTCWTPHAFHAKRPKIDASLCRALALTHGMRQPILKIVQEPWNTTLPLGAYAHVFERINTKWGAEEGGAEQQEQEQEQDVPVPIPIPIPVPSSVTTTCENVQRAEEKARHDELLVLSTLHDLVHGLVQVHNFCA